jgi:hypothetical protein
LQIGLACRKKSNNTEKDEHKLRRKRITKNGQATRIIESQEGKEQNLNKRRPHEYKPDLDLVAKAFGKVKDQTHVEPYPCPKPMRLPRPG